MLQKSKLIVISYTEHLLVFNNFKVEVATLVNLPASITVIKQYRCQNGLQLIHFATMQGRMVLSFFPVVDKDVIYKQFCGWHPSKIVVFW